MDLSVTLDNRFLIEDIKSKIELLSRKYYSDLTPEEAKVRIGQALKADPTPGKKYLDWVVKMHKEGVLRFPEDAEKVQKTLKQFDRVKKLREFEGKDIGRYGSYGELVKGIEPYLKKRPKREERRVQEVQGAKVVLDKPPHKVYRLDTEEAAAKLCRNTEWCVKDPLYYRQYAEEGPIYLIYKDEEKYALAHYETNQFMNKYDEELSHEDKFKIIDLLEPVTGINKADDPDLAYEYAAMVVGGRWPEGEDTIKKDGAYSAYRYAAEVIDRRWPEAEEIIKKDPDMAYNYAKDVIKGRWPEGEEAIKKGPYSAYYYARDIIQGIWPEGEEVIKRDPYIAHIYAKNVIKGRWPEGEEAIKKDPQWAYWHAIYVIKGRWPEGEEAINKVPGWADAYARFVRRTEKAEAA